MFFFFFFPSLPDSGWIFAAPVLVILFPKKSVRNDSVKLNIGIQSGKEVFFKMYFELG